MLQRKLTESSKYRPQFSSWFAAFVVAALLSLSASAQQTADQTATPTNNPAAATAMTQKAPAPVAGNMLSSSASDHYRIGPGDVLDIRILNRPNLSRDSVRVEGDGTIRMPLIDGRIEAACLTETELSQLITNRYLKFYKNPQVDVFIKDFRSTQVSVIGEVNDQGRFLLQRRIRLLELLTFAKGAKMQSTGQTVYIVHSDSAFQCKNSSSPNEIDTGLSTFKLRDTLLGDPKANPFLENGDIVTLPPADQIFVVGNVLQPRTILLSEPVSLTRAIAMSGGLAKDTKKEKIRVVRKEPGSSITKEIFVDLSAIEKKQAEDIALQANDIVDVPISGSKSILRSMVQGIGATATQMPLRIIP
jgi:polysaccharide export outer membrane protein